MDDKRITIAISDEGRKIYGAHYNEHGHYMPGYVFKTWPYLYCSKQCATRFFERYDIAMRFITVHADPGVI
jgi:hypothetical protein